MRRNLALLLIGLFMVGVNGKALAAGGPVAIDLNCTEPAGCVQTNEISDGAVSNSKIADGSVTDAKIAGTISASKIQKPANVVVVAKSGGDYTSISAAMAAINPTAENPYVVKVMPGTYQEPEITYMKSYVRLEGAGREITTLKNSGIGWSISCSAVTNATISGFTFISVYRGIGIVIGGGSNVTVENNHFTGYQLDGIHVTGATTSAVIRRNIFSDMGSGDYNPGILVGMVGNPFEASSPVITENLFKGNYVGIDVMNGSPIIENNKFTENAGGIRSYGVPLIKNNVFKSNNSSGIGIEGGNPIILNNTSTGNSCDISIYGSLPHISYNVFDTLCGNYGAPADVYVGKYNLKSDGTDAPTTDTFQ